MLRQSTERSARRSGWTLGKLRKGSRWRSGFLSFLRIDLASHQRCDEAARTKPQPICSDCVFAIGDTWAKTACDLLQLWRNGSPMNLDVFALQQTRALAATAYRFE